MSQGAHIILNLRRSGSPLQETFATRLALDNQQTMMFAAQTIPGDSEVTSDGVDIFSPEMELESIDHFHDRPYKRANVDLEAC